MKISIVTSLYQSQKFVIEFYERHKKCIEKINLSYEFIFVNDGSPDNSSEMVKQLRSHDDNVKLIDLSRNFGQHAAMYAALYYSTGDLVMALDCDLEEEPENILGMYLLMQGNNTIDVVYGVTATRSGGFLRNYMGTMFYKLLNLVSEVKIPRDQAWQRLMKRVYVDSLLQYTETESLPAGLMALAGFCQVPFLIEKPYKGTTSYSFRRRWALALNSILSFSSKPLIFICVSGLIITTLSAAAGVIMLFAKLLHYNFQTGWLSLFLSIWFIGGLNLFSLGIIGLYLAKIFNQVKARPKFLVKSFEGIADRT
ncbi:MAG: glycosyltransferase family 2 protein [Bdellovibrionaceae bacterium]|nr:glycosyltransferase family 2 protein [Pseudobdellovibrionaceae bacterium]